MRGRTSESPLQRVLVHAEHAGALEAKLAERLQALKSRRSACVFNRRHCVLSIGGTVAGKTYSSFVRPPCVPRFGTADQKRLEASSGFYQHLRGQWLPSRRGAISRFGNTPERTLPKKRPERAQRTLNTATPSALQVPDGLRPAGERGRPGPPRGAGAPQCPGCFLRIEHRFDLV